MLKCPSCGSSRFFFVQKVEEYSYINSIKNGSIELGSSVDSVDLDESFLACNDCDWEGRPLDYEEELKEKYNVKEEVNENP